MDYSSIRLDERYTCAFGADRVVARSVEKINGLILVRIEERLLEAMSVGLPEYAEIGSEMWITPEMIEPMPTGAAAYY